MRRRLPLPTLIRIISVCALLLLLSNGATSFEVNAAPARQTTTFAFTGAVQTYTVPAGITQIAVVLNGAQGGSGNQGIAGGSGGQATATISVTPGEVLQVIVGGQGGAGGANAAGAAGFNDGGAGTVATQSGGGGGGSSDVRRSAYAVGDRLIVAGGGGGGGGAGSVGVSVGRGAAPPVRTVRLVLV